MKTKIIDGKTCVERDVVYSDFGAQTQTEKKVAALKSSDKFKTEEGRADIFTDRQYSWTEDSNPYEYFSREDELVDKSFSDALETELGGVDKEYANPGGMNTRLMVLKRPLHIQLKNLYREHSRFYRSQKNLKPVDVDLLIEDFRYELHRVIAKAKDKVIEEGGNMDTILKVSGLGGGQELQSTLRELTILFKRVEQAYIKFGYIPRVYQTKMNDSLSVLISHFILDIYGSELEKRKLESSELTNSTRA